MLRVLVLEDEQDTAATAAMLLRLHGHDVEVAADGPTALQAVQSSPPDVVLLDLATPKTDGWHVARQIRANSDGKRPLLIAVSGYGTEADCLRSYESGIDLHLIKPVEGPRACSHMRGRKSHGPRYYKSRKGWYTSVGGKAVLLAQGSEDDPVVKVHAERMYQELHAREINVSLYEAVFKRVEDLAAAHGLSHSAIINVALRHGLPSVERFLSGEPPVTPAPPMVGSAGEGESHP